jgi:hypothetical protein
MFSVLFSGGVDDRLSVASSDNWFPAYFQKIEHPLLDVAKNNPPGNHEAKLNFRLTIPVVLHILHVPADWHWTLPVLSACGTCALLLLSCVFAFRATGDRVCGLYTALAVSATYAGSFGFAMYYDTIALAQIVLAMLPGVGSLWKGILVFTGAFTDERALLAALFLLVQTICSSPEKKIRDSIFRADFLAVVAGMAAYGVGRLALENFAGLTSRHEGVGQSFLLTNFPFWHAGTWLALKGGWLLAGVAAMCLWQYRQFPALSAFVAATCLCLGAGFLVEDVLRSTAYVFPVLLVAMKIIGAREKTNWVRLYCLAAFVISALAGNYNVWRTQITWFQPVAAKVLYHLLHAVIGSPLS